VLHPRTPWRAPHLPAAIGGCILTIAICSRADSGPVETGPSPRTFVPPTLGLTWPVATYEAESGRLSGTAIIVGSADGSDRSVGDPAGEASHRQAVLLTSAGDTVSWVTEAPQEGVNALVLRYSIPDAAGGGGATGTLELSIRSHSGATPPHKTLTLTSRYAWLYGGVMDGTKLFNVPANAASYATASTPTHLYDEIQLTLGLALQATDVITLEKTTASGVATIAVDFVDLEAVPPPLPRPTGFLSITDPRCGALALDLRQSGSVFDGQDDSSYGSVFNTALGNNPYNPASDVVDAVIPDGIRAELTNSTIDNVWVEHTFSGIKTNQNSQAVHIAHSRVRNTFADGIDFYGSTRASFISDSSARSTGDDGFAMWAQGSTLAAASSSNRISDSTAQLQWYGNGFAIYGGTEGAITRSTAADILNYPCLLSNGSTSTFQITANICSASMCRGF